MTEPRAGSAGQGDDDGAAPFLHGATPRWVAGGLSYVVILLVLGAVIASIVINVPETVSSEFLLVPSRGVDPVRAARAGRVTEVGAAEGTAVGKGQTLFAIRSGAVGDQSAEMATLETQLRGAVAARANAHEKYDGQRRADEEQMRGLAERRARLEVRMESQRALGRSREVKYQTTFKMAESELASVRAEIDFKREHVTLAKEIASRHRWGYEANFLSWQEYTRASIEASRTAVELEQLQRLLDVAELKLTQLRTEREVEETEWRVTLAQLESDVDEVRVATERLRHETAARAAENRELDRRLLEDVEKATIRVAAVRGALVEAQGDRLTVSAPCAGVVVRLAVKRQDAVVHEGEILCEVACSGERLQAELTVPPSGIGKIKQGQGVKLRYAAFPYERYGIRYATVHWVSSVGVGDKGSPAFRALAGLEEEAVKIDGQLRPLLAGMGGRADIVVGRRSLVSYAFEPLRRLREDLAGGTRK